jgi:tRNA-dihydrouridine synthase
MRLGWDTNSLNAPEIARRAVEAGVQLVTVHGRTRCQFYKGAADWSAIRRVKEAVAVPVVANGDLLRPEDAAGMLAASGADAVMLGRAAYGQPWIVGQTGSMLSGASVRPRPAGSALCDVVQEHYEMMLAHYGNLLGIRIARKHLGWYLERFAPGVPPALRGAILTGTCPTAVGRHILMALDEVAEAVAA